MREPAPQMPLPNTLDSIGTIVNKSIKLPAQVAAVQPLDTANIGAHSAVPIHCEVLATCMTPEAALYLHSGHLLLTLIVHQFI